MSNTTSGAVASIVLRRTLAASRERVFAAWTQPGQMKQWYATENHSIPEVQIDLRVGGAYRIAFEPKDGSETLYVRGTFREVRSPERLQFTWGWEEDDPSLEHETLMTVDFFERDNGTELVLTHDNFIDPASRDRHQEGWSVILDNLVTYLVR